MTLEERIEKLESELKRAKRQKRLAWGAAAVVIVLAAVVVYALANTPAQGNIADEIRARKIVLVAENGKERVVLDMDKHGTPALSLRDENGKTRASLKVIKDEAALLLYDENGKTRASLGVDKDGAGLVLSDENGKSRAALQMDKDGTPALTLADENGKTRAGLGVDDDGPRLDLYDEHGKVRTSLGMMAEEP